MIEPRGDEQASGRVGDSGEETCVGMQVSGSVKEYRGKEAYYERTYYPSLSFLGASLRISLLALRHDRGLRPH